MLGMAGSEEIMANGHSDYDLDIDGVVAELGRLRSSLGSSEEEFGFLANLLQSGQLQSLVQAHSTIMSTMTESQCQPVLSSAEDIAFEVMGEIQLKGLTEPDAVELFRLLQAPHMLNMLSAHDMVAQKDYAPRLPDLPTDAEDEEEETVKIVQLVKSNEPLVGRPSAPPPPPPPPAPAARPAAPPSAAPLSPPPVRLRPCLPAARGPRSLSSPRRRQAGRAALSAPNTPLKSRPQHRLLGPAGEPVSPAAMAAMSAFEYMY